MKQICYKTSKDYKRLKELLDRGFEVVCFTTYDFNENIKGKDGYFELMTTDICYGKHYDGRYQFAARGIEYAAYWPEMRRYNSFEQMAEDQNIEFIEPTITF